MEHTDQPTPQFYGRRKARPLRGARQDALDTLLPALSVAPNGAFDPVALFPDALKCWLDIGFGNGELLARWVHDMPDTGFIGCEPFINGVSNFLKLIKDTGPQNIRIHMDMAETLLPRIAPTSLDTVSLLNPDPWPKKRHHKRRFVQQDKLDAIARILKSGGTFFTCTDHPELAEHMAIETVRHDAFTWGANGPDDWKTPPAFWAPTRYAEKDMAGHNTMFFLTFTRK